MSESSETAEPTWDGHERLDETGRTVYLLCHIDGDTALVGYRIPPQWWVGRGELTDADIGDAVVVVGLIAQSIRLKADRTMECGAVLRGSIFWPDDGSLPFMLDGYRLNMAGALRYG